MSKGPGTLVETQIPQLRNQFQYAGRSWAEFDILSLLKPLRNLHGQWNTVRLLTYPSKGQSTLSLLEVIDLYLLSSLKMVQSTL